VLAALGFVALALVVGVVDLVRTHQRVKGRAQ
jgi:hypothetical protein